MKSKAIQRILCKNHAQAEPAGPKIAGFNSMLNF